MTAFIWKSSLIINSFLYEYWYKYWWNKICEIVDAQTAEGNIYAIDDRKHWNVGSTRVLFAPGIWTNEYYVIQYMSLKIVLFLPKNEGKREWISSPNFHIIVQLFLQHNRLTNEVNLAVHSGVADTNPNVLQLGMEAVEEGCKKSD